MIIKKIIYDEVERKKQGEIEEKPKLKRDREKIHLNNEAP